MEKSLISWCESPFDVGGPNTMDHCFAVLVFIAGEAGGAANSLNLPIQRQIGGHYISFLGEKRAHHRAEKIKSSFCKRDFYALVFYVPRHQSVHDESRFLTDQQPKSHSSSDYVG